MERWPPAADADWSPNMPNVRELADRNKGGGNSSTPSSERAVGRVAPAHALRLEAVADMREKQMQPTQQNPTQQKTRTQTHTQTQKPRAGLTVLTFALKHRPRATRASVPKVRTGCRTCKKRHVKCDEARPSCARCLRLQDYCDGYDFDAPATSPAAKHGDSTEIATSTPAAAVQLKKRPSGIAKDSDKVVVKKEESEEDDQQQLQMLREPADCMFSTQEEQLYFDRWLALAPNLGGGWFESRLWTTTIPQICRNEPAVRYAAIAVGAMAEAMSWAMLGKSYHHVIATSEAVPHYLSSLEYHNRAIQALHVYAQPRLKQETDVLVKASFSPYAGDGVRPAVLACLLFVCLQALQGDRNAALAHIKHGLRIVDHFIASNVWEEAQYTQYQHYQQSQQPQQPQKSQQLQQPSNSWAPIKQEESEEPSLASLPSAWPAFHPGNSSKSAPPVHLTRLLAKSPAPYVLDDEVMQVFRRLDFQSWSLGVFCLRRTLPADIHFKALDSLNLSAIPKQFSNMEEARMWWDMVQHWNLQFPRHMVAALNRYMDAHPQAVATALAEGRMLDICDVPGARTIQRTYLHCLDLWKRAFTPLYEAARLRRRDGDKHDTAYLRGVSLQIQFLLAWIGIWSLVYSDYKAMYQITPQFRELTRLSAVLLPKQPHHASGLGRRGSLGGRGGGGDELFTMDNGPTMALFVVSCKCRAEEVREESIRLLGAYPRRDGFWDSKILYAISRWNQRVEIENETEGTHYEQWHRLRQREAVFDEMKPQAVLTAFLRNGQGEFERRQEVVRWD